MALRTGLTFSGRQAVYLRLIDRCAQLALALVKAAMVLGLAYFVEQAFVSLAGRDTSLIVAFFTSTGCGVTAAAGAGVGTLGATYGVWQRRLHRRAIAHFAPRLAELERRLDPSRTTSGLTDIGQTHPDDE